MNKQEFIKYLKLLDSVYKMDVDKSLTEVWYSIFRDFTEKEFGIAIRACIENEKFKPTPAVVLEYIPKEKLDYAEVVLKAVRKFGSRSDKGVNYLKNNYDDLAVNLYSKYGTRVGMSKSDSTNQKFLLADINDEAESYTKYNTKITDRIQNKSIEINDSIRLELS